MSQYLSYLTLVLGLDTRTAGTIRYCCISNRAYQTAARRDPPSVSPFDRSTSVRDLLDPWVGLPVLFILLLVACRALDETSVLTRSAPISTRPWTPGRDRRPR